MDAQPDRKDEQPHRTVAKRCRSAIDPNAWRDAFDSIAKLTSSHAAILWVK